MTNNIDTRTKAAVDTASVAMDMTVPIRNSSPTSESSNPYIPGIVDQSYMLSSVLRNQNPTAKSNGSSIDSTSV